MQDLRLALRKLAKAVVVVTAQHDGIRYAMSATAVSEVSFEPPTMLVCVNRNASIHPALVASQKFCLNILNQSQEDIARLCGGGASGEARFSKGGWDSKSGGPPHLAEAEASISCNLIKACAVGTHDIFIGEVDGVITSSICDPLVYVDGGYAFAKHKPRSPEIV
jgi:flavin reductase (DIM6/NTAB) family NADH-FMN oxidoreductase RutF